jgi:hypothetical protein
VETLLGRKEKCQMDSVDIFHRTPLLDAIKAGNIDVARCPTDAPCSIKAVTGAGSTALDELLNSYHFAGARALFHHVLREHPFGGDALQHLGEVLVRGAVLSGWPMTVFISEIAQTLSRLPGRQFSSFRILSSEYSVSIEDIVSTIWENLKIWRMDSGGNLLHWVVQCANESIDDQVKHSVGNVVDILVDHGVLTDYKDHSGLTPIDLCHHCLQETGQNQDCQALINTREALEKHVGIQSVIGGEKLFDEEFESFVFDSIAGDRDEDEEMNSGSDAESDLDEDIEVNRDSGIETNVAAFSTDQIVIRGSRGDASDDSSNDEYFDAQTGATGDR